jgi:hypothetical protein
MNDKMSKDPLTMFEELQSFKFMSSLTLLIC